MLQTPREDDVAVQPLAPGRYLGERHSHLESDAGLFGKNTDWAKRAHLRNHLLEQRSDGRRFACKMVL